jgi:hypothetical protein
MWRVFSSKATTQLTEFARVVDQCLQGENDFSAAGHRR